MTGRAIIAVGVAAGLTLSGVLVWRSTEAAFTATTGTPTSTWQTGSVVLSDDAESVAFAVTDLQPGQTGTRCIAVTYEGTVVPAEVRLYAADKVDEGLGAHLLLEVSEGTGGGFGTCAGFVAAAPPDASPVVDLPETFVDGWGTWAPSSTGSTRTYEITYTVAADAPQAASVGVAFVWEARG